MADLKGKAGIVTGGSSGIGFRSQMCWQRPAQRFT